MGNSKSRLRKALLFLDTTNRVPVGTVAAAHGDIAAVEVEVVDEVAAARPRRQIVTDVASIVGKAAEAAAVTGSREEYLKYTCCI